MSIKVDVLEDLTAEDAKYMGKYMARAMSTSEPWAYILTETRYKDAPELHELLFEGLLLRGSVTGKVLATPDKNGCLIFHSPGAVNHGTDLTFSTDKDGPWNQFVKRAGGQEALEWRWGKVRSFRNRGFYGRPLYIKLIGRMLTTPYSSIKTSKKVHPDFQGKGYAKALVDYVAKQSEASGVPFYLTAAKNNLSFYQHLHCRPVAEEWLGIDKPPEEYPELCRHGVLLEGGLPYSTFKASQAIRAEKDELNLTKLTQS